MPLGPGTRLDAYELIRPLGSGGMGGSDFLALVEASGQDRVLGTLDRFWAPGASPLALSRDGKVIVYNRLLREGTDLMLIENFR